MAADPGLMLLDQEYESLRAEAERVPELRSTERPADDRWSMTEIVEHVARVVRSVARLYDTRAAEAIVSTDDEREEARRTLDGVARVRERAERLEAPERVRPTGGLSREAALQQLAEAHEALRRAYLAASPEALDGIIHTHHRLGPMTLRGWLTFVAHHTARHRQQLAEIASLHEGA